ncbi:MAG: O-antigen polymerase [Lachnospiraceae bacterium]
MKKLTSKSVIGIMAAGYACSLLCGKFGIHFLSGLLLIMIGGIGAIYYTKISKKLTDFRVLLCLSWMIGEGIAAFKLSHLQAEWTLITWLCFGGFFFSFLLAYEWAEKKLQMKHSGKIKSYGGETNTEEVNQRLYYSIWIVCIVSLATFLLEVALLGYIPLFSTSKEQTYGEFHISGIHYFTVSCMFTHSLTLIYILEDKVGAWKRRYPLIAANFISLVIPIMCVSKFQFLLTVLLPVYIFLQMKENINWKRFIPQIAVCAVLMGIILTILVMRRNYEEGYLESIFEMKNSNMPMIIQYIYMYIANNFDNFNCLTQQLPGFAWGMKQLFPIFALTGLKFIFPQLVSYPIYTTKTELTTLTIIYDAYYDFGIIGVILFGILLGVACAWLTLWTRDKNSPYAQLFYGLTAVCISLAFFSTWFSNPTIWFWYAIALLLWVYVSGMWKKLIKFRRAK